MDGDAADLPGIAGLKRDHPFVLLLDEAHGSGVYGPNGRGYAAEVGLQEQVDVTVVTLSKALGCAGGAVCGPGAFCEAVVNHGRPYVYSTALPPSVAAGAEAAIRVLEEEPGRQAKVRELASRARSELGAAGFALPPGDSPILPVVLGTETAALAAADRLAGEGLLALPIRPPTVAKGSSRLRITLSGEHTDDELQRLIRALKELPLPRNCGTAGSPG
jgi:7-keto-8-aminopelargonate synthetase-like enzyme